MASRKITWVLGFIVALVQAQDAAFNSKEFYPIDNAHSYIEFSVKYMGYAKIKGNFEKFKGTFRYDENDVSKTSASLHVTAGSIDTDNERRDKDLKSDDWFDIEKFPSISFRSKVSRATDFGFEIVGDLTIKTITEEVIVKMNKASGVLKDTRGDHQVILSGEITINRSDFGIEGKKWSAIKEGIAGVADEIAIEISFLGKQHNLKNLKNWVRDESKPMGNIYKKITAEAITAGLETFEALREANTNKIHGGILDKVGYVLLREGKISEALAVFKKNVTIFDSDSRQYNAYAEALAISGNLVAAKKYYQKALELDDTNYHASEILRYLK